MKATIYLRIAAALALIHCILHTVGGVFGSSPQHSPEAAVEASMKITTFPVMGVMRSFWDFYFGYGLMVAITLLILSVLLWQLGALAKTHPTQIRPLLLTLIFNFLAISVVAAHYFFLAPAITEILIALFIALAFFAASPRTAAS